MPFSTLIRPASISTCIKPLYLALSLYLWKKLINWCHCVGIKPSTRQELRTGLKFIPSGDGVMVTMLSQIAIFMGPTWVLSAPGGSHVGPMKLAIKDVINGSAELRTGVQLVTTSKVIYINPGVARRRQAVWYFQCKNTYTGKTDFVWKHHPILCFTLISPEMVDFTHWIPGIDRHWYCEWLHADLTPGHRYESRFMSQYKERQEIVLWLFMGIYTWVIWHLYI